MKKIFFITFIFISCGKKDPTLSTTSFISYLINDTAVIINNANSINGEHVEFVKQSAGPATPSTRYLLNGDKGSDNFVVFSIVTDTLALTNYHYDTTSIIGNPLNYVVYFNHKQQFNAVFFSGDYLDINISSYSKGIISGTFTAKLSPFKNSGGDIDYNQRGTVVITKGILNNVPVIF